MVKAIPELAMIVERYPQELETMGVHVEHFLLFGSQAEGTATEDSDIDLFAVS